jgi:hypothetical protein
VGPFTDGLGHSVGALLRNVAGELYAVGTANDYTRGTLLIVVKLDARGSLATAFGDGGVRLIALPEGISHGPAASLDSRGHIVVAGRGGGSQRVFTLKIDLAGNLVRSYGTDGVWQSSPCGDTGPGLSLAIEAGDNAFVVARCNGAATAFKLDSDGRPVAGFGDLGVKTGFFEEVPSQPSGAGAVLVDASGHLYVAGSLGECGDLAVAKMDSSGHLLTDFGAQGRAVLDLGGNDAAEKIALDGAGRLYIGSRSRSCLPERPGPIPFVVVRLGT